MIEWYFYTHFYPLTDTAERRKSESKSKMDFFDREHDLKLRKKGNIFEVDKKRAEKLASFGAAEILEDAVTVNADKKG